MQNLLLLKNFVLMRGIKPQRCKRIFNICNTNIYTRVCMYFYTYIAPAAVDLYNVLQNPTFSPL